MTPAPGDYNPEKSEKAVHDNSPKYTFGHKTQVEKPSQTPGTALSVLRFACPNFNDIYYLTYAISSYTVSDLCKLYMHTYIS
jgi:hypothetical protein